MKNINIREKIAVDKGQWMVKHPETNINQVMGLSESLSEIEINKTDKTYVNAEIQRLENTIQEINSNLKKMQNIINSKPNYSDIDNLDNKIHTLQEEINKNIKEIQEIKEQINEHDEILEVLSMWGRDSLNKTGDTAMGIIKAHSNTEYGVGQIRNIIISKNTPNISQMKNGDIWLQYSE